jgi:hypothetical protein
MIIKPIKEQKFDNKLLQEIIAVLNGCYNSYLPGGYVQGYINTALHTEEGCCRLASLVKRENPHITTISDDIIGEKIWEFLRLYF